MPIIRDILWGAAARGVSLNDLCKKIGIEPAALNDSSQQLPFDRAIACWEIAIRLTGDQYLGLHIGQTTNPSIMGLVGHLMQSSPTLKIAFEQVAEHADIATNMFRYRITRRRDYDVISFEPSPYWISASPGSARHAVEQAMAGTLQVFQMLAGETIKPASVSLTTSRPRDASEYNRVFATTISYRQAENQMVFSRPALDHPVVTYDQSLFAVFDKLIRDKKSARPKSITEQLIRILLEEFKGQVPGVGIAAASLNMSIRSLQRKLSDEHTSYRAVSDEIRERIGRSLLKQGTFKVSEIARLTGYADVSAFRRARRRWER